MEQIPILDGPDKSNKLKRWWVALAIIWVLVVSFASRIFRDMYPDHQWVNYIPAIGAIVLISVSLIVWARNETRS